MTKKILLEAQNLMKSFGDFKANDDISLTIYAQEIHALLGENGAGKSTFVKMLYGLLHPDQGRILFNGEVHHIKDPAYARKLGIAMVFQHFSLFDALNVSENIALALDHHQEREVLDQQIRKVSKKYGLAVEPDALIFDLSAGERQRVEIIRCLLQNPKLIIMDEPTSVLTPQEANQLFVTLKQLTDEGCAILYISHRLEEIKALCHHATILRYGKKIIQCNPLTKTVSELAALMVGKEIHVAKAKSTPTQVQSKVACLQVQDLSIANDNIFGISLQEINLVVEAGQIVAIAGIAGNGQSELFDVLSGEVFIDDHDGIKIHGQSVGRMDISMRRCLSAAFVPEERIGHATVPSMTLSENVLLTRHRTDQQLAPMGIINHGEALKISNNIIDEYDVRTSSSNPEASKLSGGNLQKFIIGRELSRNPSLVIINQPSWGVDAGAAANIKQALIDLAGKGAGVLVISQDLDEIFEIADVVKVLSRGRLSKSQNIAGLTREKIGLLMGGVDHDVA